MVDNRAVSVADIAVVVEPVPDVVRSLLLLRRSVRCSVGLGSSWRCHSRVEADAAVSQGNVLFVRFYEGEGAKAAYKYSGGLAQLMEQLVDVPQIVNSMPDAIRVAVMQSRD